MKSVEELDVFKLAHDLTLRVYRITADFPKEETFGLISQMRRAATSIGMNLAEGSMRLNSREYRQYVGIARGSAGEVCYQLLLAKDLGYLPSDVYEEIREGFNRVGQMLTRLGQSLDHD
ncbi:MAG: four helix bundle protein [Candidatus Binatia bacterium]